MQTSVTDILIRLGWALLCGFSAFMVPLLCRRGAYAESLRKRVFCYLAALVFLCAFVGLAYFLWQNKRADEIESPPPSYVPPTLDLPPAAS
ncbi:MAG: hypothetical protein IK066_07800 [Kiritimatiellae bacterium]|nr:hypothetical protein [Kiritimatiellia bacterium]